MQPQLTNNVGRLVNGTGKPTLLSMKRKTTVTTQALAERARLPIADVFVVETGGYSSRENAQRVVTAFNQLSGMRLRLEDIAIHLKDNAQREEHQLLGGAGPVRLVPVKKG